MNEVALNMRDKISRLQDIASKMPVAQYVETHRFASGVYAREVFLPKGTMLIGQIHKTEHISMLMLGTILLADPGLTEPKIVKAPMTIITPPGMKRIGLALEDVLWTTVHAVQAPEDMDLTEIENKLVVNTWEEYDEHVKTHPALLAGKEFIRLRTCRTEDEKHRFFDKQGKEIPCLLAQ